MKEQINRYEKYALVYPITFVIMAILMIVQGIMERSTFFFFSFIFCGISAIMFFYLVKNHYFRKMNAGYVVGSVIVMIGLVLMNVLMMLSCPIPDFVMHLYGAGMAIAFLSYFYGAIKARK